MAILEHLPSATVSTTLRQVNTSTVPQHGDALIEDRLWNRMRESASQEGRIRQPGYPKTIEHFSVRSRLHGQWLRALGKRTLASRRRRGLAIFRMVGHNEEVLTQTT